MNKLIDMHVHSTYSDGTKTPRELVKIAKDTGLAAFALTDHDTTEGLPEILAAAKQHNILVIPGVELSTGYKNIEQDVHILGYNINYNSPVFIKHLRDFQNERDNRNKEMLKRMEDDGFDISYEKVVKAYPDAVITRAHFARFLMDKGIVTSLKEGFSKYLSKTSKYYVPRKLITPKDAVEIIKKAEGKAILAHPLLYGLEDTELQSLISSLKNSGLDGIEAVYSLHNPEDEIYVRNLANKFSLKISGGSDYHGDNKPDISMGFGKGNLRIPYELLEQLELVNNSQEA